MVKKAKLEHPLKHNWKHKPCQKRLVVIDVMQGIAMLWVVFGHHLFDFMPSAYHHLHYYIYSFHMPLFIFISSFLIAYSYKGESYWKYVLRRFHKFFVPYVLVGMVITLLAAIKGGIASIPENLINLVISPKQSEATFLWYIYLLFFLYAIFPLLAKVHQNAGVWLEILLLGIGIYFYVFPVGTPTLCLDYFSGYFLFYAVGIVTAWHYQFFKSRLSAFKVVGAMGMVVFVALTVAIFVCHGRHWEYIAVCFAAIPAMWYVSCMIEKYLRYVAGALTWVSKNCFRIYLIHMFFVQAVAVIVAKFTPELSVSGMAAYLAVSTIIAITGSVLAFKLLNDFKNKLYNISNRNGK